MMNLGCSSMPLSPAERAERLKFLDLADQDGKILRQLQPRLEPMLPGVIDDLYDHLQQFPETARLLRDRTTIKRLKSLQLE